jgi:hypothetical protein
MQLIAVIFIQKSEYRRSQWQNKNFDNMKAVTKIHDYSHVKQMNNTTIQHQ